MEYFLVTYIYLVPLFSYKSNSITSMSHFTFDILLSLSCLLLATRLVIWKEEDRDLCGIPVDFFPVYTDTALRTANYQNLSQIPSLCSVSIFRKSLRLKDYHGSKLTYLYIFVVLISNSWDTELNPGPNSLSVSSHFPCGLCDISVGWEDRGICCDTCNVWYHIDYQGMSLTMYSIYNKSLRTSVAWECMKCGMPNFSTSLFDTSASLDTHNRFYTLSSLSEPDSVVLIQPTP